MLQVPTTNPNIKSQSKYPKQGKFNSFVSHLEIFVIQLRNSSSNNTYQKKQRCNFYHYIKDKGLNNHARKLYSQKQSSIQHSTYTTSRQDCSSREIFSIKKPLSQRFLGHQTHISSTLVH